MPTIPLATLHNKWPRSQLNRPWVFHTYMDKIRIQEIDSTWFHPVLNTYHIKFSDPTIQVQTLILEVLHTCT